MPEQLEQPPQALAAEVAYLQGSEVIADQHDFLRTRFLLPRGNTMTFRGREDLPELPPSATANETNIVTADEASVYTPQASALAWREKQAPVPGLQIGPDVHDVDFIASTTPRGVVDAAITLTELGFGDPQGLGHLQQLRDKVMANNCDDEVLDLFDSLYVSNVVRTDVKTVASGFGAAPEGMMQLALAMAGEESAQAAIDAKRQSVEASDSQIVGKNRDGQALKTPGEALSQAEQEQVAQAHLVAVHTSQSIPQRDAKNGLRGIHVTGDFDVGAPDHFPRASLHWSLNHPVASHMMGDFKGRESTIVDNLEHLTEANGAPAVLLGVDSYFLADPNQPIAISDEASLVTLYEDAAMPFVTQNEQGDIALRSENLTTEDLKSLGDFFGRDASELIYANTTFADLTRAKVDEIKHPDDMAQTPQAQEYLRPHKTLLSLVEQKLPADPNDEDYRGAIRELCSSFVTGEVDIARHPELHKDIVEAARILAVDKLILAKGGKVAQSNLQSQYMTDPGFDERTDALATVLHARAGLHSNQMEEYVESVFASVRGAAVVTDEATGQKQFAWDAYNDERLWSALTTVPWQVRRQVVRTGLLNATPGKFQAETSIGL